MGGQFRVGGSFPKVPVGSGVSCASSDLPWPLVWLLGLVCFEGSGGNGVRTGVPPSPRTFPLVALGDESSILMVLLCRDEAQAGVGWNRGGERGFEWAQGWGVPALTCLSLRQTVEHGFPSQPSALTYDPILRVMAIGTKAGAVKLYPFQTPQGRR